MNYKKLAIFVRNLRTGKGLTRKEMAKKLIAITGCDWHDCIQSIARYENKIFRWEGGKTYPKPEDMLLISTLAGIELEDLIRKTTEYDGIF